VWKEIGGDNPVIHARLPGYATVRGDWFLLIGKESRSRRLGERAIDLLSRRRTHLERLEAGMGLPVRRLLKESWDQKSSYAGRDGFKHYDEVLTAMADFEDDGRRRMVRYSDFLQLGCTNDEHDHLQWLWRSRLRDYNRHDRVWEQWLGRLVTESVKHMRNLMESASLSPIDVYDFVSCLQTANRDRLERDKQKELGYHQMLEFRKQNEPWTEEQKRVLEVSVNNAWGKFNTRCDRLVSELTQQTKPNRVPKQDGSTE